MNSFWIVGCSEKDAKTFQVIDCNDKSDDGFQFKVELLNTSSCNVDILNSSADTGPITEQAELLTLTSVAVQSNDQSEALEETSAVSGNMVDNLSQSQHNVSELKSFETIYKEEFREVGVYELDIDVRKDNHAEKYSTSIEVCSCTWIQKPMLSVLFDACVSWFTWDLFHKFTNLKSGMSQGGYFTYSVQ